MMLITIAAILFVLWLLGFPAFHLAGGFIHLRLQSPRLPTPRTWCFAIWIV